MKYVFWIFSLCLLTFPACSDPGEKAAGKEEVSRYGMVIKVKPEKLAEYKTLHANPWPGVNKMLCECNIRNYSIYYRDGFLFSYFEYTGIDFEADMQKMAADSLTREWWKLTDPCQEPLESAGEGVWWAEMEEVYHLACPD
jgi:L-rhamnose mutarotase